MTFEIVPVTAGWAPAGRNREEHEHEEAKSTKSPLDFPKGFFAPFVVHFVIFVVSP